MLDMQVWTSYLGVGVIVALLSPHQCLLHSIPHLVSPPSQNVGKLVNFMFEHVQPTY